MASNALPLARPAQAKIQMLTTSSWIVTILLKSLLKSLGLYSPYQFIPKGMMQLASIILSLALGLSHGAKMERNQRKEAFFDTSIRGSGE